MGKSCFVLEVVVVVAVRTSELGMSALKVLSTTAVDCPCSFLCRFYAAVVLEELLLEFAHRQAAQLVHVLEIPDSCFLFDVVNRG